MKIKVCGITQVEQLQQLQQLGVDYAGMIFYEGSKRYVGEGMSDEKSKIKNVRLKKVGVFVNAKQDVVEKAIADYQLNAVQLHGNESAEFCVALKRQAEVIKVFRIRGDEDPDAALGPYQASCDYFLFDTDTSGFGGSGKQFDWKILEQAKINKPFFLSGGIGLEDADKIKSFRHPFFYAVDVNSRFETAPGVKDMHRIRNFINSLKNG